MKRAASLIFIVAITLVGFLSIRGTLPFMPIFGTSMEPWLHAGDLIVIKETAVRDIKVGDVIVFTVSSQIRDHYNYPPTVAHRVVKVVEQPGGTIVFRTKGDNTGEDPFSTLPQGIRGKVSERVPFIGFPFLFLQSKQGLIFVVISLILLAIYLYLDEITMGRRKIQEGVFSPVLSDNRRRGRVLEGRTETLERGMEATQHALESFAGAIGEYAEHLKSHTSAIQGLAEASHELKRSAVEQNKVLANLTGVMERGSVTETPAPKAKATRRQRQPRPGIEPAPTRVIQAEAIGETPETRIEEPQAKAVPQPPAEVVKTVKHGEKVTRVPKKSPPGCWKSSRDNSKKA
jgi:signal peptidase I